MHTAKIYKNAKIILYNFAVLKYNAVIQTKHAARRTRKRREYYEKDDRYDVGTVTAV